VEGDEAKRAFKPSKPQKEASQKKEIARSAGGLKVCGKRCFMDQSEIFLYSLKPSALNYDRLPKFLVATENKSRIFFKV
jgi:hypothetical protein